MERRKTSMKRYCLQTRQLTDGLPNGFVLLIESRITVNAREKVEWVRLHRTAHKQDRTGPAGRCKLGLDPSRRFATFE